jgi:hypothetical protein
MLKFLPPSFVFCCRTIRRDFCPFFEISVRSGKKFYFPSGKRKKSLKPGKSGKGRKGEK